MLVVLLILATTSHCVGKPMPTNVTLNVHDNCRNCTQATSGELENDLEFDSNQIQILEDKIADVNSTLTARLDNIELQLKVLSEKVEILLQKDDSNPPLLTAKEEAKNLKAGQPAFEEEGRQIPNINLQILSPHFGLSFGDRGRGAQLTPKAVEPTFADNVITISCTCTDLFAYILFKIALILLLCLIVLFLAKSMKFVWDMTTF